MVLVVGRKVVKKIFFFSDVAKKIGKTWRQVEKKDEKKCAGQKISLFLNGNSTNRSKKWYTQVIMELTTSQENKFRFKRSQTSNQWVVER